MGGGGGAAAAASTRCSASARDVPGGKVLAVRVERRPTPATLRELAEKLRDKLGDAVVLVGAPRQGQGACSSSRCRRRSPTATRPGDLIKGIAQIVGGSGGGRPDMAQAGGTDVAKLDEALESLYARLA